MRNGAAVVAGKVLLIGSLLGACAGPGADDAYPLNQVEILGVTPAHDGTVTIAYRTPAESMWSCPGVYVVDDGDTLRVWFARAAAGEQVIPDVAATVDTAKNIAAVKIPQALKKKVMLDDGQSTRTIWEMRTR
jgi:hypothetical protein